MLVKNWGGRKIRHAWSLAELEKLSVSSGCNNVGGKILVLGGGGKIRPFPVAENWTRSGEGGRLHDSISLRCF